MLAIPEHTKSYPVRFINPARITHIDMEDIIVDLEKVHLKTESIYRMYISLAGDTVATIASFDSIEEREKFLKRLSLEMG